MAARIQRAPDGGLSLDRLDAWLVAELNEVPGVLAEEPDARVRRRLYPSPSGDPELRGDWERLVHPDLRVLYEDARETVRRDLRQLMPDGRGRWRLEVPRPHVEAWLAAINAARLTLSERHNIGQEEMERRELEPGEPRALALARIHLYGWIQELIIESLRGQLER